jgi:hypothetical protein
MKNDTVFRASEFLEDDNLVWDEDFNAIRKQLSRVLLFHCENPHPSILGLSRIILGEVNA